MATPAAAIERGTRPNILLIMADDLGVECLGSYGGTSYATPALDAMAESGLRFTNAFATPLCSTTRVELMTGRSSHRDWTGFGLLNPRLRTFGHMLAAANYRTSIIGKWQLASYDPPDYPGAETRRGIGLPASNAGFDEYILFHTGHTENKGSRYADPTLDWNGDVRTSNGKYGPRLFADACQEFITEASADSDQPWFLYYPMALPHWPMVPTPASEEWAKPELRDQEDVAYFGDMVAYMDQIVGRLVDTVTQASSNRPTLVLFYADNGTHLKVASQTTDGWKPGGKGLSTDAGTRVPLIAWSTEGTEAGTTDALVGPVDFYTTLQELAAADESTEHLDSISFLDVLAGSAGARETWTCYYEPRPGWDKDQFTKLIFTQDERYKLYSDGRFYDTVSDAYENRPIPESERTPSQTAVVRQLDEAMQRYLRPKPLPAE